MLREMRPRAANWPGLTLEVTEDQIIKALAVPKKPLTRGLSAGPQADPAAVAAEGKFVQTIRNRTTRSLSVSEREEIATLAKDKPNIDLEITFDYNSADISAKSLPAVQTLGVRLPAIQSQTELDVNLAALAIATIIPIVLFLAFQRLFLRSAGLSGAVKG